MLHILSFKLSRPSMLILFRPHPHWAKTNQNAYRCWRVLPPLSAWNKQDITKCTTIPEKHFLWKGSFLLENSSGPRHILGTISHKLYLLVTAIVSWSWAFFVHDPPGLVILFLSIVGGAFSNLGLKYLP